MKSPVIQAFLKKLKRINLTDLKTNYQSFIKIHKLAYNSNKIAYVLFFLLALTTPLLLLLIAYVDAKVIDQLVTFVSSTNQTTNTVVTTIIIYISLLMIRRILSSARNYLDRLMFFDTTAEILMKLNQTYMKLDAVHFDDPQTSDLIKQANGAHFKAINFLINQFIWLVI